MNIKDVLPTEVILELADRFEEGQRLDVAHRAAHLDNDDIGVVFPGDPCDPLLDLVGDMRNDLHGAAQIIATPLLGDDFGIDLAGRHVAGLAQVGVDEAFVMAKIEVGLGAVVRHEDLTVLVGRHRARIDVDIGIQLLEGDA